ncbi:MAG: hypothetical protein Q9221_000418 [Calogaya cf. arnoldii]
MVKLPSLKEICHEELRLDSAATKRLRADAKKFREAWLADHGGSNEKIGNKELATRYFTDGYEVAGVRPGSLLWQPSGADIDAPRNILPKNEEILLRGVERVFNKLEYYARDKRRKPHCHTTSSAGVIASYDDDDDDLPDILDLLDTPKKTASASGREERANQVAQPSTPTRANQAEDTSAAHKDLIPEAIWDPIYDDIPKAPEDVKDKEYEPSIRLSDEPRRLPNTRKETERRQHLPLSQRSCESTLIPMEEALHYTNKRKRNQGPRYEKSPSTAEQSATGGGKPEDVLVDASSMPVQSPAPCRQNGDVTRRLFVTPNRTPSSAQDDTAMHQSATKRPKHGDSSQPFNSATEGRVLGIRPWLNGTGGNHRTGVMAPPLQSEMEVPDSRLFVGEDILDDTPTGQEDGRSRTFVAPTSPHNHVVAETDDNDLYDVSTRVASILGENSPVREESVDLGSGFSGQEAETRRDSAGDVMSLPPNIWILAPNRSWVFWDKRTLDDVTLCTISEEVKSHMGLEHVGSLTMRISDRKEKWTIALRLDQELRHQDIKAMVKADKRLRDVYYSPGN